MRLSPSPSLPEVWSQEVKGRFEIKAKLTVVAWRLEVT